MSDLGIGAALERANAVAQFIQGEILAVQDACVVIADAAHPLCQSSVDCADREAVSEGIIAVPQDNVEQVVVISQTCDLQETTADEYRCLVAPVVVVGPAVAEDALRGRRPNYAALPWLDGESVADLTLVTTVERSVLIGARSIARPVTPHDRTHFATCLARSLARPALPNHIGVLLGPFAARIRERYDRNSDEGQCLQQVLSVRLQAKPDLDAPTPALTLLVVIETRELPPILTDREVSHERIDQLKQAGIQAAARAVTAAGDDPIVKREAWTALAELWLAPCVAALSGEPLVGSLEAEVLSGTELDYERSIEAPELDVHYLSTRPRRPRQTS